MYTACRHSVLILILLFSIHYFTFSAYAVEKNAQHLVCLQAVRCDNANAACVGGNSPHRVRLTSEAQYPALPAKATYIVECLSTKQGQICTTGNADSLATIGWNSSLPDLKSLAGYNFEGLYKAGTSPVNQAEQPLVSDSKGTIEPLEWQSSTTDSTYRTFYALNFYEPKVLQGNGQSSQQQGTFDLIADNSDCTSLQWDPYGVVFDSKTLEPIPGTRINLFQKNSTGFVLANIPGVTSSILTRGDGVFNFVVPDGVYKIEVAHPNYLPFPADFNTINPAYAKIYADLYPDQGINMDIVQMKGIQQHRDIPLTPKQGTIGTYPIQVMDYYQILQKFNSILVIKGRVSHPLTKIKVYTNASPKKYLPVETRAAKDGTFKIEINMTSLPAGEYVAGLDFEKTNLLELVSQNKITHILSFFYRYFFKEVSAEEQTTTLVLDPIPNTLEGFAYDKNGKVLPNAVVGIYLPFSEHPFYEITADSQGYYKITSDYLPPVAYTIQYTGVGQTVNLSTAEFLLQNEKYLQSKDINPFIRTNSKGAVVVQTPSTSSEDQSTSLKAPEPRYKSPAYYLVIIAILLFGIFGTVLGVYLINKKNKDL